MSSTWTVADGKKTLGPPVAPPTEKSSSIGRRFLLLCLQFFLLLSESMFTLLFLCTWRVTWFDGHWSFVGHRALSVWCGLLSKVAMQRDTQLFSIWKTTAIFAEIVIAG